MSDDDENHLIAERRAKLAKLRERGTAFPNDFRRDALAGDILTAYGEKSGEALDAAAIRVRVAGRMRAKRVMGKASFAKLEDSSGAIQLFLQHLGARRSSTRNSSIGMSATWSAPRGSCSAPRPANCRCGRSAWCC